MMIKTRKADFPTPVIFLRYQINLYISNNKSFSILLLSYICYMVEVTKLFRINYLIYKFISTLPELEAYLVSLVSFV